MDENQPLEDQNSLESAPSGSNQNQTDQNEPANQAPDNAEVGDIFESKSADKRPIWRRYNIYLALFGLLLLIAGGVVVGAYLSSKKANLSSNIKAQNLSPQALQQLANSSTNIGQSGQLLNVESSTIFSGQILARQDLGVAGNLTVGGTLAISSLSINGTSQLGTANINKNLAVAGLSSLQGPVTIGNNLQVAGKGVFSGDVSTPQLTTNNLVLSGDLTLNHHLLTTGPAPGLSNGSALGSGGTASLSGTDTAGTITINTGSSPIAGCFVSVNFASAYSSPPHILLTPVGQNASGLSYYINRGASSFSVCVSNVPPASSSFGFDYFVVD